MSTKFLSLVGLAFIAVIGVIVLATVFAFPTKWVVNWLFSPTFITAVFGVVRLNFWRALALNFITASLFKGTAFTTKAA